MLLQELSIKPEILTIGFLLQILEILLWLWWVTANNMPKLFFNQEMQLKTCISPGCGYSTAPNIVSLTNLFMFIYKKIYKQNLFLQVTLPLFGGASLLITTLY